MLNQINAFYSPESISFQNTAFRDALIGIVETFRTDKNPEVRSEFEMAINEAIKKYTNMNFNTHIGDYPMGVEVPPLDKNSPLTEGYHFREVVQSNRLISDIRKNNGKVSGMIDPGSSFVYGYLAELPPNNLYLNGWMIYQQKGLFKIMDSREYTDGEIVAAILHEVGHVFAFFEFLVRFRTDNQILGTMVRDLDGTTDQAKREIIIKETGTALGLGTIDAQDLSNRNNVSVYTVIISNMARMNRSANGGGYDINSFEALADQFANRHGAGRDLVTCLDKVSKGTIYRRGWTSYLFFEFVKVGVLLLGLTAVVTGNVMGSWLIFGSLTTLIMVDSHHDWYDKTGYRFKRVRNDLLEQLKDPTISKEISARIRDDIDVIEEINSKYKDHTQLIGLVYDYLIPSGVSKRKDIEFQQALEGMASNKLFYYANQLKHA